MHGSCASCATAKFGRCGIVTLPFLLADPFVPLVLRSQDFQKTHRTITLYSEMALLHVYLPPDALSCMSEELKLQLDDALWREKQEDVMVYTFI